MKKFLVPVIIVIYLSLIHPFIASAIEPTRQEITTGKAKGGGLWQELQHIEPARQEITTGKVSFSLGADVGYLSGYSLYHITFDAPYLIKSDGTYSGYYTIDGKLGKEASELEFPLDSYVGKVNASLGEKNVWSIDLSLAKNLTGNTGKMKDSDWEPVYVWSTGEKIQEKTIYSESDTDMDALFFDLIGRYYFLSEVTDSGVIGSLGVIGGYRYQNLSFDISNVNQWSPIGIYSPVYVSGKVATYEITYNIPYAGVVLDWNSSGKFSLNLLGAYGKAYSKDEDDHILRSKKSTAKADGPFYSLKAQGAISLSQKLSLLLALEYLKIEVKGKQKQVWYATTSEATAGTTLTDIDYSARSEQTYIWTGIRYIF